MTETRKAILTIVGAIVFLGVALAVAITLRGPSPEQVKEAQVVKLHRLHEEIEHLRGEIVWNCTYEENRKWNSVAAKFREEIHSAERTKAKYLPDVPKALLHRLVRIEIRNEKRRLETVAPSNCAGIYTP